MLFRSFGDADRVWQAINLDVTKYDASGAGTWTTFELNFDKVKNNSNYVSASEYNMDGYSGSDISGYVPRGSLESFRLSTYLINNLWIGSDEIMTIYFDDIELLDTGTTLPSEPPGSPGMWVEPHAGSVMDGGNVFVDVKLTADDVYGVEFDLDFDPSLLEVVDADGGTAGIQISVGSMWPGSDYTVVQNTADNGSGTIEFAAYLLDPQPEMDVVAGQVARIEFHALDAGVSDLDLDNALGSTKEGASISFSLADGTLEVLGSGSVHGIVEVQGRSGPNWDGAQVIVSGGPCGGYSYSVPVTAANGAWSISGIVAGTYEVSVEMPLYLDGLKMGVSVTGGGDADVGQVKVLGGDCNDDDTVNINDATILGPAFGSSTGGPGWDASADINADGSVNILDAAILGGNWHKSSSVLWP